MATNIFIDPLNGTDAVGKGAIGDPYKSTVYALNNHVHASFPVYVNIRSTAADVITENLAVSLVTYQTNNSVINSSTAHVIFRGYDNTENDGGKGILDGDGSYSIFAVLTRSSPYKYRYTHFVDLEMRNTGSNYILSMDYYCNILRCIFHNCAADRGIDIYPYTCIKDCYFYNCGSGSAGSYMVYAAHNVTGCFFYNYGPNYSKYAINARNGCHHNIVVTDNATSGGIYGSTDYDICNNTIISTNNSSSNGIVLSSPTGSASNNIVIGFSNGGYGIYDSSASYMPICMGNSIYNCTNAFYRVDSLDNYDRKNEILDTDPLMRIGDISFTNRLNYFEPLDVGQIWSGSHPWGCRKDRGAVQHKDNVYIIF